MRRLNDFRARHPPKRLRTKQGTWEYLASGRGEQTLLLLPGAPGRGETAFEHILRFESEYRVIAPSYPAFPRTVDEMLDGLAAILDAESVATACVVGGSYSGLIAQRLVRRFPDRVEKLVLSDTGVPNRRRGRRYLSYLKVLHALPLWAIRALWRIGAALYLREIEVNKAFWRAYFRELVCGITKEECVSRLTVWIDFDLNSHFSRSDLRGWPGRILIIGAEQDTTFPPCERAALKRLYPQAEVRTFTGGHAASLSSRGEYLDAIAAFLRGCPGNAEPAP